MKTRCYNPKATGYANYGGRGIKVCDRWRLSFLDFYADMGKSPPGTSIDRKNVDGDYEPNNCRWATRKEQAENRQSTRLLRFRGETKPLTVWASEFAIRDSTIIQRLGRGWTIKQALTIRPGMRWSREKLITYRGKTMRLAQWAATVGIGPSTLSRRLKQGLSFAAAIRRPVSSAQKSRQVLWRGVTAPLTSWSKVLGLSAGTLQHRLDSGHSVNVAFTSPKGLMRINSRYVYFHGEKLPLVKFAVDIGMSRTGVIDRLARGMTAEEIAETPSTVRYLYRVGRLEMSVPDWSRRLGIPASTLYDRLRRNWPVRKVFSR